MNAKVILANKAMADLGAIWKGVNKYHDDASAYRTVNALLDEAERLGQESAQRPGDQLDGYDGPPAREVYRWVCLAGRYELHYEVLPAYAIQPATIAILRASHARKER
ncbi:type II toxin-antitoxin system RelE/ParE family toxin [Paraburkholderia guartelaensis]|jgi:plasmid stabilization system protein ParE|uniref:Type II toxin-antitoxin system RelE/ParE family toxin n=1 Tax=Paraburkholderia guartelaensis TaxID=2546446 RepID=A0A4V2ZVL0_9BURK|nr:type II toxin-antitoxin system RelE/ParE family toxin [Paraburkholderia guartelaensis]TDG05541.1 type II toxin-antitoxin system RelE/ParE family toxin [Paraburkholderia guartelaensis]